MKQLLLGKLWERHLFYRAFVPFILITVFVYALFVVVDFSINPQLFKNHSSLDIINYYLQQFIKRSPKLISFALLLSTLRLLFQINEQGELTALQMTGLSPFRLLFPFWRLSLISALFIFFSFETFYPQIAIELKAREERKPASSSLKPRVITLPKNSGKLIFQRFDALNNSFYDVIWFQEPTKWHSFEKLDVYKDLIIASNAAHFTRDEVGETALVSYKHHQELPPFIPLHLLTEEAQDLEDLAILGLFRRYQMASDNYEHESLSWLIHRLLQPAYCFFAVLLPAPFALRFRRKDLFFLFATLCIAAFAATFTLLHAGLTLAEHGRLSPYLTLLLPFFLINSYLLFKLQRG